MNKRGHAAHALYKAPSTTPPRTRCVSFRIPDSLEWQMLFDASFASLQTWINYHRSGTVRESEVAQVWREIRNEITYGNCNSFEGVSIMPVGAVIPYAGSLDSIPDGWFLCAGAFIEFGEFLELDAVIDPQFYATMEIAPGITVDGYHLPNLCGRTIIGANHDPFYNDDYSIRLMGAEGGAETHTLTTAQIPNHSHNAVAKATSGGIGTVLLVEEPTLLRVDPVTAGGQTTATGGGGSHNNMQPFQALNYIIKYRSDTIEGTPGEDGKLTMLRQNPLNPFLMEQSFNSGLEWSSAFDYSILECEKGTGGTSIDITNVYNDTTNYILEINNQYDGDVTNVYPEAIYDGSPDDALRNLTLCWTLKVVAEYLQDLFIKLAEENEDVPDLGDLIISGAEVVATGLAGFGAVFAAAGSGNLLATLFTAIGAGAAFRDQLEEFEDMWDEFHSDPEAFGAIDLDSLICCLFNALQGELLSETGWKAAFNDCLTPDPSDSDVVTAYKLGFRAIGTDDQLFAVWLDLLNVGFVAQQAGVVFDDCPCLVDCLVATFEDSDTEGWTAGGNTTHIVGQGFRGDQDAPPGNRNARCLYDMGTNVFFKNIKLEWHCARNDDSQFAHIEVSENGTDWTMLKNVNWQPVGRQTETWNGDALGRYVRLSVAGSDVANRDGQIYGAQVCYIPIV